ncbi:Uncharacterised protein [Streptococcus pneumoniae]|nr:hypothetical protein [Streptococcus pneumoniae]MDG7517734.1 hypothetical protein [Streptococcus pneumoniae]MDG8213398.1 hypothetical protein [Streptococcus pneumoniae]MDG8628424.1 hypothetical protein [Streptococcus pneumoniae]MDG8674069.1 hypothetical protein [Streptococcus pneumoniae]MDG9443654.1 hypothetical protein [Streptococcus pneumoniae]
MKKFDGLKVKSIRNSKGEIIKNIVNENFTNYSWDVPFSRLGG